MRTSEMAKLFGVHTNTIRLYESWGYISPVPRDDSGQREFTEKHIEQMRLARLMLHESPQSDAPLKDARKEIVWLVCSNDLQLAITQTRKYAAFVKSAQERAANALAFLRGELPEIFLETLTLPLNIQGAAAFIGISVPVLRRWEAYGLIQIPRHPTNKYRIFGRDEMGWLLVIQSLRQAGYKILSCRQRIASYHRSGCAGRDSLCDAIADCMALFQAHESHIDRVLQQLYRMNTVISPSDA